MGAKGSPSSLPRKLGNGGEGGGPGPGSAAGPIALCQIVHNAYGWKFMGIVAVAMWVVKGFVWGFSISALEFLLREYSVTGPRIQVYKAVVMLPWAMKPVFGLISDALPIFGYRKMPYIILASLGAMVAYSVVGFSPGGSLPVRFVILGLLCGCAQASIVDLLIEAAYAERIREKPEHGPDLISFVWGGITVGGLLATASVGFIIEHAGPHWVYAIVVLPAASILVPTCLNWLEEPKMTQEEVQAMRIKLWEQREIMVLVMLIGVSTLLLISVGLLQDSVWVNMAVASVVAVLVVGVFTLLLKPVIGKMNCFFFIQTCCVIDISGATFYFFTDSAEQYPDGPHFSKVFYASGLGVFLSLLNLLGLYIYNRVMKDWRYHGLFIFANLLQCAAAVLGLLVYTRFNLTVGLPDTFFVMGTMGAWAIVHMWMWIPGVVLMSQLCPKGVEATMYALLAGCHNLGLSISSYAGACMLVTLGIRPKGADNEGHNFENLWVAALIQALAPVVTLILLPFMIPNARQTEKLLDSGASAVDGSPWQRLVGARTGAPRTQYGAAETS